MHDQTEINVRTDSESGSGTDAQTPDAQTPDAQTLALARRLERSVSLAEAPGGESVRSGPFRAFFDPHSPYPELNYAMPVDPLRGVDLQSAVDAVRRLFRARGRRLRVEFVGELWPGLPGALAHAGLRLASEEPLMACTPATFAPRIAPEVSVRALAADDPDAALATYIRIRDETDRDPPTEAVARLREQIARGGGVFALASVAGEPAGTGRCLFGDAGLGELVAIVTTRDLRRRGVAGTVVSELVRRHFAAGGAVAWLSAASGEASSVYARLGFRSIGSLLNYEEDAAPDAGIEGGTAG